jgi:hypothetical protein
MADVRKFVTSVQERYGMRPVVPFEQPIEIGDIGTLGPDGAWNPVSTTRRRFSVAPTGIRTTRDGSGVWSASSGKEVSFKAYAEGEVSQLVSSVADARARAEITFESSSSFVFAAKNVTIRSATEVGDVIEAIRRAYHERDRRPESERWYKEYVFVFGVGDADAFTAMLRESQGHDRRRDRVREGWTGPDHAGRTGGRHQHRDLVQRVDQDQRDQGEGSFLSRVPAGAVDPHSLGRRGLERGRGILATDVPPTPGFADTFEEPQTTPVT